MAIAAKRLLRVSPWFDAKATVAMNLERYLIAAPCRVCGSRRPHGTRTQVCIFTEYEVRVQEQNVTERLSKTGAQTDLVKEHCVHLDASANRWYTVMT